MAEETTSMNSDFYKRYSRQLILPEIGMEGQKKLSEASVLVVGAGGLGCPILTYLVGAGVGRIGIVDDDVVDISNLHRQVLYSTGQVGQFKVDAAAQVLRKMNPNTTIDLYACRLTKDNAEEISKPYEIIIDGTDNFPTRYLVNDLCVLGGKVNIYGSIFRFEGQATVLASSDGPCYRCLFPQPPKPGEVPNCAEGGVLGILPGQIGLIQATEAIKWITGSGRSLVGRLLIFDALEMSWQELKVSKNLKCPLCGDDPSITELMDTEAFCGFSKKEESVEEIEVEELSKKLNAKEDFLLLDVREEAEVQIAKIEGSRLIPLGEVDKRHTEITDYQDKLIVVHCHHGGRSAQAVKILKTKGFNHVLNLKDGIDQWSIDIDPEVPQY